MKVKVYTVRQRAGRDWWEEEEEEEDSDDQRGESRHVL